ncbi:MAG: cyclodeaminase/cyclohydrolase family protein [Dehalococcoidia bacterium]|nr:cyclodeaminase/cyclohydrolase family protein [Dehalococcoidia bacterium]MDH4299972.1 cyclodeaminase/cyclohydrolase family protein [Dehalococcoidia bacterium]MDH4367490.1 cyclodeaminase/cyclohydrolase family protein [Dehalococcoidia bacterium]
MLEELTIEEFLQKLAARQATPGGGSVAALSGALSAGLVSMAAEFSGNKDLSQDARTLMNTLTDLIDRDAKAFAARDLREATRVPLQTAKHSYAVLKLAGALLETCNPRVITDIGVAAKMAESAVKGAMLNVEVNLVSLRDEAYKEEVLKEAQEFSRPESLAGTIVSRVEARLR